MTNLPRTPTPTLERARKQAIAAGLKHVYTGNVHDSDGQSTYCAGCRERLIERNWYELGKWRVDDEGNCEGCGKRLNGHFAASPGTWGSKRQPVRIG